MKEGGEFAGEAGVGEEIGTIGGDFDFDERVGIEEGFHGSADFEGGVENEEAVFLILEANFGPGGEHAAGVDAAHFTFANFEATGEFGSGEAAGDLIADFVIVGSANDLAELTFTGIDLGHLEAVGVRVLDGFFDFGNDDERALDSDAVETFHFDPGKGEEVADFVESARAEVESFFEPIERDVHVAGRLCGVDGIFNGEMREISLICAGMSDFEDKAGTKIVERGLGRGRSWWSCRWTQDGRFR